MSVPKSPWRIAGDNLLFGGPVDREALILAIATHVPPNVASNSARVHREQVGRKRGHNVYLQGQYPRQGDQYEVGARQRAAAALRCAIKYGTWVRLPDGRIALRNWREADQ